METGPIQGGVTLSFAAVARLMPLYVTLDDQGQITSAGPTLQKLLQGNTPVGLSVDKVFELRRPRLSATAEQLQSRLGERIHLCLREDDSVTFRGVVQPLQGDGLFLNLSFGIAVVEAVRRYGLTEADFAVTDLAVEMLYLVEAKTAVMDELRLLNRRLQGAKSAAEEQALTDTLTRLRNRRALDFQLSALISQGVDFGVMHIDLDYFKQVNDRLGHAAGDHVLREVASVLLAHTRTSDTVARVGGDEFVILLPGLCEAAVLGQIARRIIDHLAEPIGFEGQMCQISASIGMTVSTFYPAADADRMLCDADNALYASKHAGRGVALFFDPAMTG